MKQKGSLDVERVIKEFQEYENSQVHRKDALKIDIPFDEALDRILKARPQKGKARKEHGK